MKTIRFNTKENPIFINQLYEGDIIGDGLYRIVDYGKKYVNVACKHIYKDNVDQDEYRSHITNCHNGEPDYLVKSMWCKIPFILDSIQILFKRVLDNDEILFPLAMQIYNHSFPTNERRTESDQIELLNNPAYKFLLIYDPMIDDCVGIIAYWNLKDIIFVEHFAINPTYRNRGYGKKAFSEFIELMNINYSNKQIILEVDIISYNTAQIDLRRIKFYESFGFKLNKDYEYTQPAYNSNQSSVYMHLMSSNTELKYERFKEIREILHTKVYNSPVLQSELDKFNDFLINLGTSRLGFRRKIVLMERYINNIKNNVKPNNVDVCEN